MRVAVLTEAGEWSASTRYRALQHVPRLRERIGQVDVLAPVDVVTRRPGATGKLRYFAAHAGRYARRAREVARRLPDYDAVLVQRGLYPMGPGAAARALDGYSGHVVYDLDDARFELAPSLAAKGRLARWLYGPHQAARLVARADAIVVSTEVVARSLPGGRVADAILPSVPDPGRYPLARHAEGPVVAGWAGNVGNLRYLDPLAPVIEGMARDRLARLLVISSERWQGPADFRRWRLAEEASVFAELDIGIMPLPDTPYTRGKAGFKLLQYMAAGLPVVASPVGANVALVEQSGAGILAEGPAEWDEALRRLAGDVTLRAELGARGREFVERYADLEAQADVLAALLRGDV